MSVHPCRCMFIPPHVLDNLARTGVGNARLTIQQSQLTRAKRSSKEISVAQLAGLAPSGHGDRQMYDNEHQPYPTLRVKHVRGEGEPATADNVVNEAYDHIGTTRDFYKNVLNRNSYDNAGSDIIVSVHVGANYNNAF